MLVVLIELSSTSTANSPKWNMSTDVDQSCFEEWNVDNVMDDITRLDDGRRTKFRHPAHRIMAARELMHRTYHRDPVRPDFSAEYEAIAAWSTVTCCYSGIEHAIKSLLQMQGTYIDKPLREGGHRHHDIGKLFDVLAPEEQEVLRVSYRTYRSLHDYIPPESVDSFLDGIDTGYPTWRYFLLEGRKPDEWAKTHPGAMLEIWAALTDIIQAKTYCNHGLHTVKTRIEFDLREIHVNAALKPGYQPDIGHINKVAHWLRRNRYVDINVYSQLFYCHQKGEPLHINAKSTGVPVELTIQPVLAAFLRNVEQRKDDNDFSYFLRRAQTSRIVWNPINNCFENALP